MNKTELTANFVFVAGIILFITGLAHLFLGIPQLNEAISQGLINLLPINQIGLESQTLAREEIELTWIIFGLDMNIFGLITILLASELKKKRRVAWSIGVIIGLFYLTIGIVTTFYFKEIHPAVLSFPLVGLLISVPLLLYRKEFDIA